MRIISDAESQRLIEGILETTPEFYDNPNGPYEYTCPFCREMTAGGIDSPSMSDMSHTNDCLYKFAKELNEKFSDKLKKAIEKK
jgi:hypothetical protein